MLKLKVPSLNFLRNFFVIHQWLLRVVNDCKAIVPETGRYLQAICLLRTPFQVIIGAWLAWILIRKCCALRAVEPFQAYLRGNSVASVAIVAL